MFSLAEDVIQGGVYENAYLVGNCLNVTSFCWLGSAYKVFGSKLRKELGILQVGSKLKKDLGVLQAIYM